jgi:hypothetical protein
MEQYSEIWSDWEKEYDAGIRKWIEGEAGA